MNLQDSNILFIISIVGIILILIIILLSLNVIPNNIITKIIEKLKLKRCISFFNFKINADKLNNLFAPLSNFVMRIKNSITKFYKERLIPKFIFKKDKEAINISILVIVFLITTLILVFVFSPYK